MEPQLYILALVLCTCCW